MKKTEKLFLQHMAPLLVNAGLKKRESGIFTKVLTNDMVGWLGLSSVEREGALLVNPFIGIRHQPTHQLISEILSKKNHSYIPPTVSIGMGFLLPEKKWREWYINHDSLEADCIQFSNQILEISSAFWTENANLKSIEKLLLSYNYTWLKLDVYQRAPVVRRLSGDKEGATAMWKGFVPELEERPTPAINDIIENYNKFFADQM